MFVFACPTSLNVFMSSSPWAFCSSDKSFNVSVCFSSVRSVSICCSSIALKRRSTSLSSIGNPPSLYAMLSLVFSLHFHGPLRRLSARVGSLKLMEVHCHPRLALTFVECSERKARARRHLTRIVSCLYVPWKVVSCEIMPRVRAALTSLRIYNQSNSGHGYVEKRCILFSTYP